MIQSVRLVLAQVRADALVLVLDATERCVELLIPLPFETEFVERGIQSFAVVEEELTGLAGHIALAQVS